jgi:prophage antirepressor-like protein
MSSASPALFKFEGTDVRIDVDEHGAPWFCAKNVGACLEMTRSATRTALTQLTPGEKGVRLTDTPGGRQRLTFVSESGLYALVLQSRKPDAAKFRLWVTSEVLPQIARTGAFAVAEPSSAEVIAKGYALAIEAAERERQARLAAEAESSKARKQVEEMRPRADFADRLQASERALSFTDAASVAKVPRSDLIQAMLAERWLFRKQAAGSRSKGELRAYSQQCENGTRRFTHAVTSPETGQRIQCKVTFKGLFDGLVRMAGKNGTPKPDRGQLALDFEKAKEG